MTGTRQTHNTQKTQTRNDEPQPTSKHIKRRRQTTINKQRATATEQQWTHNTKQTIYNKQHEPKQQTLRNNASANNNRQNQQAIN